MGVRIGSRIVLMIGILSVGIPVSLSACFQPTPRVEVNATTLHGRVTDSMESPVESAAISVSRVVYRLVKHKSGAKGHYTLAEVSPVMRRTVTDAEGRFELGMLDPGTYVVRVGAESRLGSDEFRLVVKRPPKETERFVEVVMRGGSCLSVRPDVSSSEEEVRF